MTESSSEFVKPTAPNVTIDYGKLATEQSFDDAYEYEFGDGEWVACTGSPIAVTLKTYPTILRVRKASDEKAPAGEITTIDIFAQKELSKLITVKYDGKQYTFNGLSPSYYYEFVVLQEVGETPDWSTAKWFAGGAVKTVVSTNQGSTIALRSRQDDEKQETNSIPSILPVETKKRLQLEVWGDGYIAQPNPSGDYFIGDEIKLVVDEDRSAEFLGWYIDDHLVTKSLIYYYDMHLGSKLQAKFVPLVVEVEENIQWNYPNTSARALIAHYTGAGHTAQVMDAQGNEVEKIGTGTRLVLNGVEYKFVLYGDVNGDADVDTLDLRIVSDHILGKTTLTDVYQKATQENGENGTVDVVTLIELLDAENALAKEGA